MPRMQKSSETRTKLLDAARDVTRTNGYTASTVDNTMAGTFTRDNRRRSSRK